MKKKKNEAYKQFQGHNGKSFFLNKGICGDIYKQNLKTKSTVGL